MLTVYFQTNAVEQNIPVIKDLTSHDVTSYTPAVLIPLAAQPVMTQHLSVEIMCFKRRVMYVRLGTFKEEKAMVIDQFRTTI